MKMLLMMRRTILLCLLSAFAVPSVCHAQRPKHSTLAEKVARWIDASTLEGTDSSYISMPERPWQIVLSGYANQSDLHMKSRFDGSQMYEGVVGDITNEPRIRTAVTTSVGLWVGYRGWGIGYSAGVAGDDGSDWDLEFSGSNYYVKGRFHNFKGGRFKTLVSGALQNPTDPSLPPEPFSFGQPLVLSSPVEIRTQLLEGVYIFQSRRFSYSAAYDQSTLQLRSAGSLIVGLRYFHSDYNYAHHSNADLILNMNDIGRIKTWQGSIGAGYTYNWVPCKGLLLNVMAMPMLTPLGCIKSYSYDSNYRQMALDDVVHSDDELPRQDYRITPHSVEKRWSRIALNFNCRASATYNWTNWYVSANANFYHSRYHYSANSGRLNDWAVSLNIGGRL